FEPVTSFSMPLLPGPGLPLPVALDAGALAFLTREPAGPVLIGFRHDTRGDFARDEGLVEEVDPRDASRPFHLVPDRPPIGTGVSAGELRVTYSKGVLELHSGSVFVPDTSYEDLELEIFVRSGPPPIAILGSRAYGATDCTWPRLVSVAAPGELLRVLRR